MPHVPDGPGLGDKEMKATVLYVIYLSYRKSTMYADCSSHILFCWSYYKFTMVISNSTIAKKSKSSSILFCMYYRASTRSLSIVVGDHHKGNTQASEVSHSLSRIIMVSSFPHLWCIWSVSSHNDSNVALTLLIRHKIITI